LVAVSSASEKEELLEIIKVVRNVTSAVLLLFYLLLARSSIPVVSSTERIN
jgi:hypothetical protein